MSGIYTLFISLDNNSHIIIGKKNHPFDYYQLDAIMWLYMQPKLDNGLFHPSLLFPFVETIWENPMQREGIISHEIPFKMVHLIYFEIHIMDLKIYRAGLFGSIHLNSGNCMFKTSYRNIAIDFNQIKTCLIHLDR